MATPAPVPDLQWKAPVRLTKSHRIDQAIAEIELLYGDRVSLEGFDLKLTRFGDNENVGTTAEQVWRHGGIEVLPTSGNPITHIISSSASDTGEWLVEGHSFDGTDLTFEFANAVTLNGQTKVALPVPLYRATFTQNNGSVDNVGDIYVFRDGTTTGGVPDTAADIHLVAPAGENQSEKAGTSMGSVDYWIITQLQFSVNRANSRAVDFALQFREIGKTFKTVWPCDVNSNVGTIEIDLAPCLILPKPNFCLMYL